MRKSTFVWPARTGVLFCSCCKIGASIRAASSRTPPLIGSSLIARAASSTNSGTGSRRNMTSSARCNRRMANSTPMRTAEDCSRAAAMSASISPMDVKAITAACRRYGSLSAFSRSRPKIAGMASRRFSFPSDKAAKKRTRGFVSCSNEEREA